MSEKIDRGPDRTDSGIEVSLKTNRRLEVVAHGCLQADNSSEWSRRHCSRCLRLRHHYCPAEVVGQEDQIP
jgi:hypothetical protein